MIFVNCCVILFILGASNAFLANSSTMSINSQSTFQQIINIFNNERHKLELYVAGKEQTFNEREFALEQRVNKTIVELAKTNNELKKEKAKVVKVGQAVDQLTVQIFNLTTNNIELQAKVRGFEFRNSALENELAEINRNHTLIAKRPEGQDPHLETASTCPKTPTVAFMAQLSANIYNRTQGRVVFDSVETNEGNAYNVTQGSFTAPFNGSYNFNLVVSAPGHHMLRLYVKKNNIYTGYVFLDYMTGAHWWLRKGTDITIHMVKGDKVWVDMVASLNTTLGGCCFHAHFSGFLIGTD